MSQQTSSLSVQLSKLETDPFVSVLCYPRADLAEAGRRIKELRKLGVQSISFEGRSQLGGLKLLGKGCVSLVVKARTITGSYALKIRRMDANRRDMHEEAKLLGLANSVAVGPTLAEYSENFILMGVAEGSSVPEYVKNLHGKGSTAMLRNRLLQLLIQCRRLDRLGLDHGELSNLSKHVLVGKTVTILDFESASLRRRLSNVTAAVQYLFIGGSPSKRIRKMLHAEDTREVIETIRRYKSEMTETSFDKLNEVLTLN